MGKLSWCSEKGTFSERNELSSNHHHLLFSLLFLLPSLLSRIRTKYERLSEEVSIHLHIYLLPSSLSICSTRLTDSTRPLLLPTSLPFSIFLPDDILDEIACQLADRVKYKTVPSDAIISKPYQDLASFRLVSRRCNVSSTSSPRSSFPLLFSISLD